MADQYGRRLEIMTQFPRDVTSSTHDADLKGNRFRRTIHPQSFIAVAFIFLVQKIEKKLGLDRVLKNHPSPYNSIYKGANGSLPLHQAA